MEERMLKLETTLNLLNQEADKLNNVLTLTTEALAVQNKLQNAQALQAETASAPAAIKAIAPRPVPADRSSQNNWLELLLSALVGGGIAAGIAHLLARRATRNANAEMPLPSMAIALRSCLTPLRPPPDTCREIRPGAIPE